MRFIKSVIMMVLQALNFNPRLKALVSLKLFSWDWQSQQDAVWLPDIRSKKYWVWHLPLLEFKDCFSDPSLELNVREDQFHRHFEERWTFETPRNIAAKLIYSSFLESPNTISFCSGRRHFINRTVETLGNSEILTSQAFSKATWSSLHLKKVLLGF